MVTNNHVVPTNDSIFLNWGTSVAMVSAASGNNILASAGASTYNRIYLLTITVDTAGLVTISDYTTLKFYLPANGSITIDAQHLGIKQGTANTAITCTNAGGGNFTAFCVYGTEA